MSGPSPPLPRAIYSTEQVRALDRHAIEVLGIAGFDLMSRAGDAAFAALRRHWPHAASVRVCCGAGNNAGDGYVVARLAAAAGLDVHVVTLVDPTSLAGDAARAWREAAAAGVPIARASGTDFAAMDESAIIVDAVLGTGLARDVEGPFRTAIAAINAAQAPVLALDCPSGLDSDTGLIRGAAVRADVTVTFVGLKQGLFLGEAPVCVGMLEFAGLGLPSDAYGQVRPTLHRLDETVLRPMLDPRPRNAHKTMNGNVLLVGGSPGMGGAIRLAAEAALRAGAGLVHAATHPDNVSTVMGGRPEIMCRGIESAAQIADWLDGADALVLGPGLGRQRWGERLFDALVGAAVPLVLDADGLYWLARRDLRRADWLLTPHPGEAARLLGVSGGEIQRDRLGALEALAGRYQARVILKGACSLVAEAAEATASACFVCDRGNPGMATAGTGDVLAGIAGALAAQTRGLDDVAGVAVLVHALAGDDAAAAGERGLLARDLLPFVRRRVNPH
jgi:hydroxyethylthiazole kinase-like uncharacterized protein yjeF